MPNYTENLNLILPNKNENYDVNVANTNNILIDVELGKKVDKKNDKDLSTNDFTDGYKNKLDKLVEGTKGDSAYQVAVENGFEGTEKEWLESLKGIKGDTGDVSLEQLNAVRQGLETEINTVKTHKYRLNITTIISANTNFTIPCNYKVGEDTLDVYYMGERLIKTTNTQEGHYKEIGADGSISNTLQLDGWSAGDLTDIIEYFEFVVRGDYSAS